MKITEKNQEKSIKYFEAVEAMRAKRDELSQRKSEAMTTAAGLRAQLETIDARLAKATVDDIISLRRLRREIQTALEDTEASAKADIRSPLRAIHNSDSMKALRTAAMAEYGELEAAGKVEVEAIQQKAKADIEAVGEELKKHIYHTASNTDYGIMSEGGPVSAYLRV